MVMLVRFQAFCCVVQIESVGLQLDQNVPINGHRVEAHYDALLFDFLGLVLPHVLSDVANGVSFDRVSVEDVFEHVLCLGSDELGT